MKKRMCLILAVLMLLPGCRARREPPETGQSAPAAETGSTLASETVPETGVLSEETGAPGDTEHGDRPSDTRPPETAEDGPQKKETVPPEEESEAPDRREPPEAQTEPRTTEPPANETEPVPTELLVTEPTEPAPTEAPAPEETEPPETRPAETEPPGPEKIDTGKLEAHARSYAFRTYGYDGDPSLSFHNAGYFPGVRVRIETMAEGYAAAERAVNDQYESDMSMGYDVVVTIDGVSCRAKLNVYFEPTSDPNTFVLWVFYG